MTEVDIILPNYNKGNYIEEAIESILDQTFKDFHLFIIDDNSTDQSKEIIKKYTDNRITHIQLNRNKGVYFCRNFGMRISNSKYISFIDSDDYWEKNKLEKQINFMRKFKHKFTYTDYIPFKNLENLKIYKKKINVRKKFNLKNFINDSSIAMSSIVIERAVINNLKFKKLEICEDYLFKCEILKKQDAFKCEGTYMYYRILKNSLQSNKFRNFYWVWNINQKYNKLNFFENTISLLKISLSSLKRYGLK